MPEKRPLLASGCASFTAEALATADARRAPADAAEVPPVMTLTAGCAVELTVAAPELPPTEAGGRFCRLAPPAAADPVNI